VKRHQDRYLGFVDLDNPSDRREKTQEYFMDPLLDQDKKLDKLVKLPGKTHSILHHRREHLRRPNEVLSIYKHLESMLHHNKKRHKTFELQ
jgi:hypothetical protein